MYERGVSDRLVQLNEALSIAKTAGVVDPVVLSARLPAQDKLRESADNNALYTLGAKNLSAEIDALSQRADEEPFIANLRLNQAKKEALEKIDLARFPVVTLQPDREIQEPQYGTPRKSTVLAVSAMLGLGLGLAFAVGRAFLDHVRSARILEEDLFSQADHGNGASHRGRSKSHLTTAR
jgi:chain length determinant protein (polysaccharide antigen chain regulator)